MEKFARKYVNRGTNDNPIWQLLPEECEESAPEPEAQSLGPECSGSDTAYALKAAFIKEFTEKNGTPLWKVMFDAVGADAFGTAFNDSSGNPDPSIIIEKLHLKYHLKMPPTTYFYSRDITDYVVNWPYPPKSFYSIRGWYTYNHDGYNAWGRSQMFFGIRENHPSSYQALQANLEYWHAYGGGYVTKYSMNESNFGTHPWAEDWGEPYLKEEWPPHWLINPLSDTWSGELHTVGDVGRGPYYRIYGWAQLFDYRFVTTMQQFLDLLMWELVYYHYGPNGDTILYPGAEDLYGQYPAGSHQFVSGSLTKAIGTYQESSTWSPGGASSSSSSTTIDASRSLLIPFMDRDWCPSQ